MCTGTFEATHSVLARPIISTRDVSTHLDDYNHKTLWLKNTLNLQLRI